MRRARGGGGGGGGVNSQKSLKNAGDIRGGGSYRTGILFQTYSKTDKEKYILPTSSPKHLILDSGGIAMVQ